MIVCVAFAFCPAGHSQTGRTPASDAELVAWLRELPPLPKVHYSVQVPIRHLQTQSPLLYEYVRITHAISLRGQDCTREQIKSAVSICKRVNAGKPGIAASIAINYSPWHYRFGKALPPTDTGRTHSEELLFMRERFELISGWLGFANRTSDTPVVVSAVLYDCERFVTRPNDPVWNKAIQAKLTAAYQIAREYFPQARIEWYARGAVSPGALGNGWGENRGFTLQEPGDSFSCPLYRVPEIQTTRDTFRKTVERADKFGVEDVTPWVALASGYRRTPTKMNDWSFDWRYDLTYSWQLGAEINHPWFSHPDHRAAFGPWQRAKVVVFYPEPFGQAPDWGRHFVAYVRGAHMIRKLPGQEPSARPPSRPTKP